MQHSIETLNNFITELKENTKCNHGVTIYRKTKGRNLISKSLFLKAISLLFCTTVCHHEILKIFLPRVTITPTDFITSSIKVVIIKSIS